MPSANTKHTDQLAELATPNVRNFGKFLDFYENWPLYETPRKPTQDKSL